MSEIKREGDVLTVDATSSVLFLGTCAGSGAADQKPVDFRRMGPKVHRGAASASYQAELLARLKKAVDAHGTPLEKLVLATSVAPAAAAGHVFLVTCLPADKARQAADVALRIRAGTRHEADGLILPAAANLLASIEVAPALRTDLMLFMNEVLVAPAKSAVLAYCTDGTYFAAQRYLFPVERVPTTGDALLAAVAGKPSCFWCAAPALAEDCKACGRCAKVAYCSKECQVKDFHAFHKGGECKGLAKGELACMGPTRAATLRVPTNVSPKLPIELKEPFDDDVICAFLTNLQDDGGIGPETSVYPLGWHLVPRERWAYAANKFSYAA